MNAWLNDIVRENAFTEFAIIFALAALCGIVGQFLRQPLLIMFIALGILIGPSFLDIIHSADDVQLLAEIGISVLLFIVGLKLDLRIIKTIGPVATLTGIGQVVFTSVVGYLIGLLLGFSALHSLYIAIALTFSSTIIIVKLLTDKKEIDSLHGQIAVGFLIVQDIVVIIMMIVLSALSREGDNAIAYDLLITFGKGIAFTALVLLLMRYVMNPFSTYLAKSPELLLVFSVAWAMTLAAASHGLGFSSEVGAFLAGLSLASTPYREAISSRLVSLRDFLLLFFFVNLGAGLDLATLGNQIPAAVVFSFFVLVGNPIIVMIIMGIMGYHKRTSFLAGLTVAQISEFSLLFAAMGLKVGHIDEQTVGLVTLVGLITIAMSTYLILYSHPIYERIAPLLSIFERRNANRENDRPDERAPLPQIIIFGMGRFGMAVAANAKANGQTYFGIDMDPFHVKQLKEKGENVIYGDMDDPEILEHVPFHKAERVISTVRDIHISLHLAKELKENNFQGKVVLTAANQQEAKVLREKCDAEVVIPYELAGQALV